MKMEKAPDGAIMIDFATVSECVRGIKGQYTVGIMFALFSQCGLDNHVRTPAKDIATHTKLSPSTIRRSINRLCDAGLMKRAGANDIMINPNIAYTGHQTAHKRMEYMALGGRSA